MNTFITKVFLIIIIFLLIIGCANSNNQQNIARENGKNTVTKRTLLPPESDPVQDELKKLTLSEKIGQMIIGGFEGTTVTPDVTELLTKYKLGGFILFGTNIKSASQLVNLTNGIKSANTKNNVPLFISVDQEGGRVNRMPSSVINTPSARIIGNTNNDKYAYKIGNVISKELTSFGFNTNFAPVLDIQSNPKNTVIGDRSFGSDASIVTKMGEGMLNGIRFGKIIPVVKHFPGHGDTSIDSHLELPIVYKDLSSLKRFEFIPFNNAIKNHAEMVMVTHILVKRLDSTYPASISKTIITGLLRKQLGFKGVIITDDMTMGAIAKHYTLKDAAVRSVNAGSDVIIVGHGKENVRTVYNSLLAAVKNQTITEDTINKSVYRILALKRKYNLTNEKVPPVNIPLLNAQIKNTVSNSADTNTTKTILLKDITSKAKEGEIINAEFRVGSTPMDTVRKKWGKEDSQEYVAAANGTYSTYCKKHVVVAYDKNQQLFEIRSFDPQLKNLNKNDIKNYLGSPKSDVTTGNNEEIISYSNGANTLKFVFPLKTLELDHYSIYRHVE